MTMNQTGCWTASGKSSIPQNGKGADCNRSGKPNKRKSPVSQRPPGYSAYCTNMTQPTGNLDTQNSSEVISLLKEASKKYEQTILMITHNRSIAQTADRVLQVSDGVLTDFGRCRE